MYIHWKYYIVASTLLCKIDHFVEPLIKVDWMLLAQMTIKFAHVCMYGVESPEKCVVPENIHTHSKEGHWKFQGGGGSQKPKFLKEILKLNWNVQGVGG